MKVSEAIEILQSADLDAEVFLSSDHEGNSYRKAYIDPDAIMCDQGEWVSCHPDDIRDGEYEGWEDNMVKAVVVW